MVNSATDIGSDFATVIASPMAMAGQGLVPFPFAYHNGIFTPVISVLGHSGAIPYVIALVLLLLVDHNQDWPSAMVVLSMIFAVMALGAENMFTFVWIALLIILVITLIQKSKTLDHLDRRQILYWTGVLVYQCSIKCISRGIHH